MKSGKKRPGVLRISFNKPVYVPPINDDGRSFYGKNCDQSCKTKRGMKLAHHSLLLPPLKYFGCFVKYCGNGTNSQMYLIPLHNHFQKNLLPFLKGSTPTSIICHINSVFRLKYNFCIYLKLDLKGLP